MNYAECKEIAENKVKIFNATIGKAYKLGDDYVFDSSEEYIGIFPVVVSSKDGKCTGLWQYLNENDMTMDDMQEVEL